MKKFEVTYRVSTATVKTKYIKADNIVPRSHGVELTKSDNTTIAFFPFEMLVGIIDLESLDKSKS